MRLYVIRRKDSVDYDEHDSAVIRAESEDDARQIASETLRPREIWLGTGAEVEPIEHDGEPGIIVESFNAG